MNSILNAGIMKQPSPSELAEMQASLQEMYVEIEASNARMEANRVEIDTLRSETRIILDSLQRMMSH